MQHFRYLYILIAFCLLPLMASSQENYDDEAFVVKDIYASSLTKSACYDWLTDLCKGVGHRLSGSIGAEMAVAYTKGILDTLGLDSVWLQPCEVVSWNRGDREIVRMYAGDDVVGEELRSLALGNAPGSGPDGVRGEVLMVMSLQELEEMPDEEVEGKIVFFNRPMDASLVSTFHAYGRAVDQRGRGPRLAARKGAKAAVVRSMATGLDDWPHTGMTMFDEEDKAIAAVAISTNDAEKLAGELAKGKVEVYVRTTSYFNEPAISYNVIGEIRGSELPEEIILVGGHLDSWDVGEGAHDDGSGCVQSMEVLHQLRLMDYKPRRTIRCVLFMNEENGLVGAREYARISMEREEYHFAAIESDAGGFIPMGFAMSSVDENSDYFFKMLGELWPLLEPYNLRLQPGGGGADIGRLRPQGGMLIGLRPDSQRYFDVHHTSADVLETVHPRELKLGAAAMTGLVYLLDKYGTKPEINEQSSE